MGFAPIYLLNRFIFRLSDFAHHWYLDGSRRFAHAFISFLENLDHALALRITFYYFWRPLYGDYTIIGHIMGVIFRSFRILIALCVYAVVSVIALLLYLIWLAIPFVPLFMAYHFLVL
jgi:hypothetical protein